MMERAASIGWADPQASAFNKMRSGNHNGPPDGFTQISEWHGVPKFNSARARSKRRPEGKPSTANDKEVSIGGKISVNQPVK